MRPTTVPMPRSAAGRALATALLAVTGLLLFAATALGHATLANSTPSSDGRLSAPPSAVTLTFTEPVQLLEADDADVVDEEGATVSKGGSIAVRDARVLEMPLQPDLADGTYTVRYRIIGADSHVIPGVFVFGVGGGELAEPYLEGSPERGPSETGIWGVSSRFLQLVGLGGLLGLLAFRWLVWAPVLNRTTVLDEGERAAVLTWGRDAYWIGFGCLAVGAMLAEGYLLIVQSAGVLGVSVLSALGDANGVAQVLGGTDFGSLVQLRGAILFGVFALGTVLFLREFGASSDPKPAQAGYARSGSAVLAVLLLAVMTGVAAQGHPRVAAVPALQISAQITHLAVVAVWISGLALLAIVFLRVPAAAPRGGPVLSAEILGRFSRVALIAVGVAVATGALRSVTELGDPAELWETGYGRSILYKLLILCPIGFLALYNRRIITALRRVERPNRATLRRVRLMATAELGLSIAVVIIASLLVAQPPGAS